MNFEALRAFVAVAEEGQFRLAAGRLGISQQAVSKRVAGLEGELGVVLFERVAAGASLTADGRTFLPRAKAVLSAVAEAVESVQRETRPLRVDVLGRRLAAAELFREFHRDHREVPMEMLTSGGAAETLRELRAGAVDAGFTYLREPPEGLKHVYAYLEPLQIVVGPEHPLAGRREVRLAEVAEHRAWVPGIRRGSEWEGFYAELSAEFGVDVDPAGPNFGLEALLDTLAESRTLLTFVGEKIRIAWPERHELQRIPVVEPVPCYPWSLVWRPGTGHRGLAELVAFVRRGWAGPAGASWVPGHVRRDLVKGARSS
ncbi:MULTISPECIES: LysR family transcriptional regulator [unclassified Amycolatopsis]|uniref:LysR family transcriptional regulator n=1 Tax=unclassified Amycolatopsis TaxID=2618356 RepID=UPI00345277F4